METLAYLYIAAAYEEPAHLKPQAQAGEQRLFEGCNWKKLSSSGWCGMLSVALSLATFTVATNAMALQIGDSGPVVTDLQLRLNAAGYYNSPITGYFGQLTQTAVTNFQKAKGLPTVGIAGPQTYAALRSAEKIVAVASPGGSTTVADIQKKLFAEGYNPGAVDGVYGPKTRAAITQFQADNGLVADGIVGKGTSLVLFA